MEPIHYEFSNQANEGGSSQDQAVSSHQETRFKTHQEIYEAGKKYRNEKLFKNITKAMVVISFIAALTAIIMAIVALDNKTPFKTIETLKKPTTTQKSPQYQGPNSPPNRGERTHVNNETVPLADACPVIVYNFPRNDQRTDYVSYRNHVTRMKEATACAWVATTDFNNQLTAILSYATSGIYNSYTIGIKNPTTMTIFISDVHYYVTVPKLDALPKFHFCHWFSSTQKKFSLYINGIKITTQSYSGASVEGGGTLILGQEQDRGLGSVGFDSSQSLHGTITNFMIWPRILSEAEIHYLAYNCECPSQYSVVMSLDRSQVEGQLTYRMPNECPVLIDKI